MGVIGEELLDECEQTLNGMPGVEAEIDRKTKLASISFDETKLSVSDICNEISRLSGVRVRPGEHIYREEKKKQKGLGVAGRTAAGTGAQRGDFASADLEPFRHGNTAC